jgi:hypothetical protein
MKIRFRIENLSCYGQVGSVAQFSKEGDVINNKFASKSWQSSIEIINYNNELAFQYDGGSAWQNITIIESFEEYQDFAQYKVGHNESFDHDEVFVVKGKVIATFSLNNELFENNSMYDFGEWLKTNLQDESFLDSLPTWVHEERKKRKSA